jgi:signal transduction histidine kinase
MAADSVSPKSVSFLSSDERLAFAVDAAEVGLFSLSDAGLVTNRSFRRHFGLDEETDISLAALVARLDAESASLLSASLTVTRQTAAPLDLLLSIGGDRPRVVRLIARLGRNGADVDGASIDRTEHAASQTELRNAARELAATAAELEQFAYAASHDLQEPLRMVTNYLSLLERRYAAELDDRAREYIRFAVDGGSRMQRLIRDLLSFSRAGRDREPEEPIPLGETVRTALRDLSSVITESGATVNVPELPVVLGHRSQLLALFANLLGNALKYRSERSPVVTLSVEPGAREWVFGVEDNGIGIEPQFRESVFEPFRRLHPRDVLPGTGLGLSVCRKIVGRYGGTIGIEAAPSGPGTLVRFTLPASRIVPSA